MNVKRDLREEFLFIFFLFSSHKKAIAPHITVQPIRGSAATKPTAPTMGKKMRRTQTTLNITRTFGFMHFLHKYTSLVISV